MNLRIQEQGEAIPQVAYDALRDLHLVKDAHHAATETKKESAFFLSYMWEQRATLMVRTGEHLGLGRLRLTAGHYAGHPSGFHT